MIRLLRHDDGAVRFDDLAKFDGTSLWLIEAWITFLAKGGPKKRFQYFLNPNSSKHFLYFRAIQDNQELLSFDPTLQDTVLLPDDFTEYIHHIGNAHDMHSVIQGGLIPGRRSLKRDRQSVFFTAVNPMYASQDLEELQYDLDKPSITVYKNTWRVHQHTENWCNLKLAQRKGLQFYQTRSHAIALFNTRRAICIEKVVFMKTGEELYGKVHQSPRLPRVVLTPNLQHGRQDPSNLEARKSTDHQSEQSVKYRETCRSHVASISKKVSEVSAGKLDAVTLVTEFKVYLTQPSRKKTRIASNSQKAWFNRSGQHGTLRALWDLF